MREAFHGDGIAVAYQGRDRLAESPDYGNAVRAFAVTTLTRDAYVEQELASPVVTASGAGWNADGMHTVDLHPWDGQWIAAVDGYRYQHAPRCELVTSLAEFDALAGEWEALLQRSRAHAVFGSHAWMRAALVSQPERAPHVVTLRIDGRLEAILPFVRTAEGIEFATFFSDYNDFIASSRQHAARAFRSLLGTSRIIMRGLREDSDALAVLRALPAAAIEAETTCYHADLDASYYSTRSHALRKAIARARRAAAEEGLDVQRFTGAPSSGLRPPSPRKRGEGQQTTSMPGEGTGDIAEIFLTLNRARFGESSRFHDPASETFLREALPPLVRGGAIEPYAILRGDAVLAIDLLLVTPDACASWNGGFIPEVARFAPGRLLFAAEIDDALAAGKRRFDLLRGTHPYKRSWATGSHTIYRAVVST